MRRRVIPDEVRLLIQEALRHEDWGMRRIARELRLDRYGLDYHAVAEVVMEWPWDLKQEMTREPDAIR